MNKREMVCYNTDASRLRGKTEKVVFPKNIEEVQKAVKTNKGDIIVRGSGTGIVGGCIPNDSVVIDLGKMNKVSNFNTKSNKIRVEAGITINELNDKLNGAGYEFPIFYLEGGLSRIGSMIALNILGERSLRYGGIKEWIEEVEFVNGRGELMTLGKADLGDVCGMEGITGIIVAIVLKVIPKVRRSYSIFQSEDINEIFSISRRLKLENEIIMLKLIPPMVSDFLNLPHKYNLIIEFDSERGKIKGSEYSRLNKLLRDVYFLFYEKGYSNSEDPKFFYDKVQEFIALLEHNNIPYFCDLGLSIVFPFFKDDEDSKREGVINFIEKSRAKPGKYGIGLNRKYLFDSFQEKIVRRVKMRYDPFNKFKRNHIIDFDGRVENPLPAHNVGEKKTTSLPLVSKVKEQISEKINESKSNDLKMTGEEKSVRSLLEELRTPDEKMEELIKEEKKREEGVPLSEEIGGMTNADLDQSVVSEEIKEVNNVEKKIIEIDEGVSKFEKYGISVEPRRVEKESISNEGISSDKSELVGDADDKSLVNGDLEDSETTEIGNVRVSDNLDRKSGNGASSEVNDIMSKIYGGSSNNVSSNVPNGSKGFNRDDISNEDKDKKESVKEKDKKEDKDRDLINKILGNRMEGEK
ncbi:FAD-binding oxidoreductase [archaeon]|nr:FAD-binding oxidoreductase [archaeon]